MPKFTVKMVRTVTGLCEFEVEAKSLDDAKGKALDEAWLYVYDGMHCEYEIDLIKEA